MIRSSSVLALLSSLALGALVPAQTIQYCTVTTTGQGCGPVLHVTMVPLAQLPQLPPI